MIKNFDHNNVIHYGTDALIIIAPGNEFSKPMCLKILNKEYPPDDVIKELENEFDFSHATNCDVIRKALKKTIIENHQAIVLEYIDGTDLKKSLLGRQKTFADKLQLATDIATAISAIHRENIIHKQISPSNIIIENGTNKIYLIDFSLATRLNSMDAEMNTGQPNNIEALNYISPEQTGRINRMVDNRADLYSLGAVLYQLFTGSTPFESKDPLELIYAHIAKTPVTPTALINGLPKIISDVVMKLLAKNAEDRYQSAFGVQHDLEICLQRLQQKGAVEPFELGANDFSGKFFIQQKLYGREAELKKLFDVFEHCASGERKLLMVSGYSGCGKSALISEVQKPITGRKGFFVKGKFEHIKLDTPYAAFVQAFSEIIYNLLAGEEALQLIWKNRIIEAVGNSGKVLTDLIPGAETLIGKQPDVADLKGIEAQNRFNYVLVNFVNAIAAKEHPLVIFIDDLQWADASSLNLFKVLMEDKDTRYFMMIGAYRNNEVDKQHPLLKTLNGLKEDNIYFDEIGLEDLPENEVLKLTVEMLGTKQNDAASLAEIVYNKTKGNAFYVHQFLRSVYEEGYLYFDYNNRKWQWNKAKILEMNVSGNVVELMTSLVQKFPDETFDLTKTGSCIGNRFDKRIISIIKQKNEKSIEELLHEPLIDGLIISTILQYKFAHDRIQQAIYSLIPPADKKRLHLLIGKTLSATITESELPEKIFDVVNQWNVGSDLITDQKTKIYLANLNLLAGRKAVSSAAYLQALQYFEKGMQLLGKDDWQNQYAFTFQLTSEAAEAAYLSGEYEKLDILVEELLHNSTTLIDSVKAYEISIKKLIAQNKMLDAIKLGLDILKKMGMNFPLNPGKAAIFSRLLQTKWVLKNKNSTYFTSLPPMTDPEKNAAMRILSDISSAAFFAMPNLVPLLVFKMVRLTVTHGLSRKSPYSLAACGFILSAFMGEIDNGITYGKIALATAKKLMADELNCSIFMTYNLLLVHWKKPLYQTIEGLEKGFKSGLETGDNEYTSYTAHGIVYHSFISGMPLNELAKKSEILDLQIEKFRQYLTIKRLRIFRQSVFNLVHETETPDLLNGEIFDEKEISLADLSKSNEIYFQNLFMQKLYLALIFNLPHAAYKHAVSAGRFQESVKGSALYPLYYFYRSLALSGMYNGTKSSVSQKDISTIKKDIEQLIKFEKLCPKNYSHKRLLLVAEYEQINGNFFQAKISYDEALKAATENNMVQDLAVCWERAAQFFIHTKQDLLARFYMQNAYKAYQRWGAAAKLKQMLVKYELLLSASNNDLENFSSGNSLQQQPADLDLATVIKASTALSGEIVLSKLLKNLMQILLENAGARSGFIIMERNGERFIEAEISAGTDEVRTLQSVSVLHCGLLAESIVKYVSLTREIVILDNATESQLFGNDEFIKKQQSKSILCVPLLNQGKMQGIIYLSNDLTAGAFTEKRLALLKLLTGQIAISIENALFYDDLEHKVQQRTNELQIEKKKSDDLLLNILPEQIANELKQTGHTKPRSYKEVTVMFTDFKDFTQQSEKLSPEELVSVIDTCFRKFDEIISKHNLEKIKTIGDAYLCVSGLPNPDGHDAANVIRAAIEIREFIKLLRQPNNEAESGYFDIRIGIHTGPLVAGVVGNKKFAYDIWGDTVNTTARMEQSSETNQINISNTTYQLVKDKFTCTHRGKKPAKNKGEIEMYFVNEEINPSVSGFTISHEEPHQL